MIIQLQDKQITKFWGMLRFAIAETFMPRNSCSNEHLRHILTCLLSGKMQCWIIFEGTPEDRKFIGFLITRIDIANSIGEKTLFLDCVYTWAPAHRDVMEEGYRVVERFAKDNLCGSIVTLTESESVVGLAERGGYSKRYYLFKEV